MAENMSAYLATRSLALLAGGALLVAIDIFRYYWKCGYTSSNRRSELCSACPGLRPDPHIPLNADG
jgi:hypothetical protein